MQYLENNIKTNKLYVILRAMTSVPFFVLCRDEIPHQL